MPRVWIVSIVSALALGLGGASPALAFPEFHVETSPVTISGSQIGTDVYKFNAGTLKCGEVTASGSQTTKTSEWVRYSPSYTECTAFGFAGATVTPNGCRWELQATIAGHAQPDFWGCEAMTIVAKLAGTTKCTVYVYPQLGLLGGVSITNSGSGSSRRITATFNLSNVEYTQQAGTGLGSCKSESHLTNGTYVGETTLGAFEGATQKGLWME